MPAGCAQALDMPGESDRVGLDPLENTLREDDLVALDVVKLVEADRDGAVLLLLERDHATAIDVAPSSLEPKLGQESLRERTVGSHRLQADLAAERPLFLAARDQERKRPALVGDEDHRAVDAGDRLAFAEVDVDVLDRPFARFGLAEEARPSLRDEIRDRRSSEAGVLRDETDDVAATAFLPEIGVEGDLHVGALGNRELLGDDRQGRGVGADVLPETPSEDGLPVGDAGRSLLEKTLEGGAEISGGKRFVGHRNLLLALRSLRSARGAPAWRARRGRVEFFVFDRDRSGLRSACAPLALRGLSRGTRLGSVRTMGPRVPSPCATSLTNPQLDHLRGAL